MKRGSTTFLKVVLLIIGIAVLALCIFAVPEIASRDASANPETSYLQYPFLVCTYVLSIPLFIALYQAFKLLIYIDKCKAFSELSVRALKYIKYCAITISIFIVLGILFVIFFIEGDRAGIIMLGLIGTFASSVIATFAAVLQRLLQEAIDIKSENDLTI
ncbi:DUF2975 domain-containing protein [Bacillus pseudomycoides]|uniref:DUF2975 domain-containing protein n=1 Tax=Bacillus bingmayongensis TaxID=1150157 RepID=A0ABU5JS24_9BACI|nr:DUF2975 domain-containing protein [Bacillus pseudomycoides]